jgi:hypothetical protein
MDTSDCSRVRVRKGLLKCCTVITTVTVTHCGDIHWSNQSDHVLHLETLSPPCACACTRLMHFGALETRLQRRQAMACLRLLLPDLGSVPAYAAGFACVQERERQRARSDREQVSVLCMYQVSVLCMYMYQRASQRVVHVYVSVYTRGSVYARCVYERASDQAAEHSHAHASVRAHARTQHTHEHKRICPLSVPNLSIMCPLSVLTCPMNTAHPRTQETTGERRRGNSVRADVISRYKVRRDRRER